MDLCLQVKSNKAYYPYCNEVRDKEVKSRINERIVVTASYVWQYSKYFCLSSIGAVKYYTYNILSKLELYENSAFIRNVI